MSRQVSCHRRWRRRRRRRRPAFFSHAGPAGAERRHEMAIASVDPPNQQTKPKQSKTKSCRQVQDSVSRSQWPRTGNGERPKSRRPSPNDGTPSISGRSIVSLLASDETGDPETFFDSMSRTVANGRSFLLSPLETKKRLATNKKKKEMRNENRRKFIDPCLGRVGFRISPAQYFETARVSDELGRPRNSDCETTKRSLAGKQKTAEEKEKKN